jgi:hypothetical protein
MSEKHAIWFVPSYDRDEHAGPSAKAHPVSYLRLGSMRSGMAELSTPELRGDDLLERAGFGSVASPATAAFFDETNGGDPRGQTAAGTSYRRDDGGEETTSSTRDLTAELMTRGGWRDHTDGNRVSTTRGDRVDFVFGNYKRVVFGRQAQGSALARTTFEISGGHLHETSETGCEVKSISWVQTHEGTWKIVEETLSVNGIERFSGRKTEYVDGDERTTTIGVPQTAADASQALSIAAAAGILCTFGTLIGAAGVAAHLQAQAGNAGGAASAAAPVAIATTALLLPALSVGIAADVMRGRAHVDDSSNPVISESVDAEAITASLDVSGDLAKTVVGQHGNSEVVHVTSALTHEEHAATRNLYVGTPGKPVSFNFEAVLAREWNQTQEFGERLLTAVGGLALGVSLVAAEKHYFGNRHGPYGGAAFPSVSMFLGARRTAALAAETSFFLGTDLSLTAGNALVCELQSLKAVLNAALKLEVGGAHHTIVNHEATIELSELEHELEHMSLGVNLHNGP